MTPRRAALGNVQPFRRHRRTAPEYRCYSALVNFDFSPDQKALRDQARKFLGEHASTVRVRRILDTDEPYDRDLWRGVAEMGWTGTAIPDT